MGTILIALHNIFFYFEETLTLLIRIRTLCPLHLISVFLSLDILSLQACLPLKFLAYPGKGGVADRRRDFTCQRAISFDVCHLSFELRSIYFFCRPLFLNSVNKNSKARLEEKNLLGILVPRRKSVERHFVQDSGSVFPDGEQFGQCTIWDELQHCLISNIFDKVPMHKNPRNKKNQPNSFVCSYRTLFADKRQAKPFNLFHWIFC